MKKEIEQLSDDIDVLTDEIKQYKQVGTEAIFEIGRRLNHIKKNDLAHGQWGRWLESIKMDRSDANKYIRIATELKDDVGTYPHLGMRALYEIATLPPEEREKEHVLLSTGEIKTVDDMTVKEIREVKSKDKDSKHSHEDTKKNKTDTNKHNEEVIKRLAQENKFFENVIEDLEYKLQNEKKSASNEQKDRFKKYLNRINENLINKKLRNLNFSRNTNIAYWLSKFSEDKQNQIEDLQLTINFTVLYDELENILYSYIIKTPISGNQIDKFIELYWKNSHINFMNKVDIYSDGGINDRLKTAKTKEDIDDILDEFDKAIDEEQKRYEEQKEQRERERNNHSWDNLFNTSNQTDYVVELGLPQSATDKDIKKAFRQLLKVLHPDQGGNAKVFEKYKKMFDEWKQTHRNQAS